MIVVDSKECIRGSSVKILEGLKQYEDINVVVSNLGNNVDFAIPSLNGVTHLIQRKGALEILRAKSVFEDVKGMSNVPQSKAYLLIEGSLGLIKKFSKWREEPVIGTLESVLEDFDVKIIPSPNKSWTVKWLHARAKRLGSVKESYILDLGEDVPKNLSLQDKARRILETLPGISTTLSFKILSRYGSVFNALNNVDDWKEIKMIGQKKIERIKEILNAKWKEPKNEG